MSILCEKLCNGVDFRIINAPKFKTNMISLFFNIPLDRETVTMASLLPAVLKRGTSKRPTFREQARYLENAYYSSATAGMRGKGDGAVMFFTVEYIRDKYIGENLSGKMCEFLLELTFDPYLDNGAFCPDYLSQEKENLKSRIEGMINDKKEYADFKCCEEMFGQKGYGLCPLGYLGELEKITPKKLYEFYLSVINNAKADVFISGEFSDSAVEDVKKSIGEKLSPRDAGYVKTDIAVSRSGEPKEVVEEIEAAQSKLSMGFTCATEPDSKEYPALMLASCMYGGSPFSKLFNNVREKLGLAYYAGAHTDRLKSVMMVSSGIETKNYTAARDEILIQLDNMKSGKFEDDEILAAKKYLTTGLNSMKDGIRTMEDYYLSQAIMGSNCEIDCLLEDILKVTREDIVAAVNKVELDTTFFLKGKGGDNQ